MHWSFWLLVVAVVCFGLAALSAFGIGGIDVNEPGFGYLGLGLFAASHLPYRPGP